MTAKKKKQLAIRSDEELSDWIPAYARKAVDPVIKFVFCDLFRAPPPPPGCIGMGGSGAPVITRGSVPPIRHLR